MMPTQNRTTECTRNIKKIKGKKCCGEGSFWVNSRIGPNGTQESGIFYVVVPT